MQCYNPLKGYRSGIEGKGVVISKRDSIQKNTGALGKAILIDIPCGQCIGCKLERSREWATRITNEAQMHEDNCWLTLTYNNQHLPEGETLVKKHYQLFMKRLRRKYEPKRIRFYMCGEYGEESLRPHYHACLFNYRPPDLIYHSTSKDGYKLYVSDELTNLWPYGNHYVGELNFETAAYTARYVTKKITGEKAKAHYTSVDAETGEIYTRIPEYSASSNRPDGIGATWYKEFQPEVLANDRIIVRGTKTRVPRYYDKLLEKQDPAKYEQLKIKRNAGVDPANPEGSYDRLRVKEKIKTQQSEMLKRNLK